MAFSYTSREEITSAVSKVSQAVENGDIKASEIDEHTIENYLYTAEVISSRDV